MEVIREIVKIHNHSFTMNLPENFLGTEVEVLVLPIGRDYPTSSEDKEQYFAADMRETIHEVKMMRAGKSPKKSTRELIITMDGLTTEATNPEPILPPKPPPPPSIIRDSFYAKPVVKGNRYLRVPWLVGDGVVLLAIWIGVSIIKNNSTHPGTSVPEETKVGDQENTESKESEKPKVHKTFVLKVNGASYEMVDIPDGEFQMGSTNGDSDEFPIHTVRVSGFRMGKTEVTQGLWSAVMGNNPSKFKRGDNYPVECVSWEDCQEFIQKLNQKTGGNYRLPTEAEWEFACRAATAGDYYGPINDIAWYGKNSNSSTHPVGLKKENVFGLYDMSGNVWEWCQDWYGAYTSSTQSEPTGLSVGEHRVCRGGCWVSSGRDIRSASRGRLRPSDRGINLGFRFIQVISSPVSNQQEMSRQKPGGAVVAERKR